MFLVLDEPLADMVVMEESYWSDYKWRLATGFTLRTMWSFELDLAWSW